MAMPVIPYGFTTHVMDFPGSVTVHHETFIRYVVDVHQERGLPRIQEGDRGERPRLQRAAA